MDTTLRIDGRAADMLRPVLIEPDFLKNAYASVLISCGNTRVICAASVEERVPPFLTGTGKGWLTAEYAMLPASCAQRKAREDARHGTDGRSIEIRRLIGRALRAGFDLTKFGERTITIDCDVLDADGGTRTASITGGYVAAVRAVDKLMSLGALEASPLLCQVAAVSVGVVSGVSSLDLCYTEDSEADTDMNIVMTSAGTFIEVQGTAEGAPFSRATLDELLALGEKGIRRLMEAQRTAISGGLGICG